MSPLLRLRRITFTPPAERRDHRPDGLVQSNGPGSLKEAVDGAERVGIVPSRVIVPKLERKKPKHKKAVEEGGGSRD